MAASGRWSHGEHAAITEAATLLRTLNDDSPTEAEIAAAQARVWAVVGRQIARAGGRPVAPPS